MAARVNIALTTTGYGFVDFDCPAAALKAVHALKTSGIQAQMAKVRETSVCRVCVCVYLACSMGLFLFNVCMCPCRAHFSNIIRLFIWPQLTSCSCCDPVLLTFAVETRCCFHSNNLWDRLHTFSFSSSLFLFFLFFFFYPLPFFPLFLQALLAEAVLGFFGFQ